jgi:hypothetical protein
VDAQDISVAGYSDALPAFEETATIFYIDISDIKTKKESYESQSKMIGTVPHKLTFGLLKKHKVAGWESESIEGRFIKIKFKYLSKFE